MFLVWFFVGAVAVAGAYFAPGMGDSLWPNLSSGAAAAAVFLVLFFVFNLRRPLPKRWIIGGWIMFIIFGALTADGWRQLRAETQWQGITLHHIAGSIDNGCMTAAVNPPLIKVLKAHYEASDAPNAGIGETFKRCMPDAKPGPNISMIFRRFDDTSFASGPELAKTYISSLTDSEVVVVAEGTSSGGINPEFKNFDGQTGMAQRVFRLTAKGVAYESQN